MTAIKCPPINKLMSGLGITKSQAIVIRNYAAAGKFKSTLEAANAAMKGYGVESLYPEYPKFYYVNMGDTYANTLCYTGASFYVGTWGDWVEKHRPVPNDGMNPRNPKWYK